MVAPIMPGPDDELPDRRLVLRGVEIDGDRVAEYAHVCGFGIRSTVPGTYPHVLAFPLHMSLMTERSFPFSVLGLVHIANRIDALAPIPIGSQLDLTVWTADLRPHRRGRQFDVLAEAAIEGSAVWRGCSTYLRQGNGESGSTRKEGEEEPEELEVSADWDIPAGVGRQYAAVSGDRNPIHMHPLSARLFGFPGAIAHGMWTKARCLAAFEGRVAEVYAIDATFRAPLRIPGRARLLTGHRDGRWAFRLESPGGERAHVSGSLYSEPGPG
jgi:acyl dehydratase